MKEEVVFIISSLGLSSVLQTVYCRMCLQSVQELQLQSVQDLQPAPGCAMGDSFPDRAETLAQWEAMPMIVSTTFSCKYIAKNSTLSFKCGTWRAVIGISIYQPT